MSKLSNLIRDLSRELDAEGAIYRSAFVRIAAKYVEQPAKKIPAIRKKPRVRKTVVRLRGAEMAELRQSVFQRDGGKCVDCGRTVHHRRGEGWGELMELSHLKSRGAGGGDTMENTVSRCSSCHKQSHDYGPSGQKPCPAKPPI
jgi:5-methylcytosine-specific restriction endonuclease McrA